ncbi:MAG: methyltransferase domain-containing protein [Bacteroidota bacterium]
MASPFSIRSAAQAGHTTIQDYFEQHPVRKLQLGADQHVLPGWLNTDLMEQDTTYPPEMVKLDARKSLPFPDQSFDRVFSEHMIEHINYHDGRNLLRECHRILKPGGIIRLATPDLKVLLDLYQAESRTPIQEKYVRFITDRFLPGIHDYQGIFVLNNAFYNWGHRFLYDRHTLTALLRECGFDRFQYPLTLESDVLDLRDLESHGKLIEDEAINRFETMVIEATRN